MRDKLFRAFLIALGLSTVGYGLYVAVVEHSPIGFICALLGLGFLAVITTD